MADCPDYIEKAKKGDSSIYVRVGISYKEETEEIYFSVQNSGWFITSVNNEEGSARYHRNLFEKMARLLEEADAKPRPEFTENSKTKEPTELNKARDALNVIRNQIENLPENPNTSEVGRLIEQIYRKASDWRAENQKIVLEFKEPKKNA